MKTPEPADVQRWSDEVARNPRSLAFLPLARAYRRRGLRDAAMQLCLRGLEHHPAHVDAHSLLALLYLERGDQQKAADEWSMVLRVDPDNFEALRGMGFCYLEQDQLTRARQMLERAALLRPADPTVQEALELLGARHEQQRSEDPILSDDPWAQAEEPGPSAWSHGGSPAGAVPVQNAGGDSAAEQPANAAPAVPGGKAAAGPGGTAAAAPAGTAPAAPGGTAAAAPGGAAPDARSGAGPPSDAGGGAASDAVSGAGSGVASRTVAEPAPAGDGGSQERSGPAGSRRPPGGASGVAELSRDPSELFDELLGAGPLLGILLVDGQGLVHAGRMTEAVAGDATVLGAVLGGAIGEAARTAAHLSLGDWRGIQLETQHALLHLRPAGSDAVVLVAARRNAPAGWVLRSAAHAADLAARYLEAYT